MNLLGVSFATVIAALTVASSVRAQGNYRSTPIGGRSALMGSTGTALGRDGSAPFLNPATIARIDDSSVAFSVGFFQFETTRLTDYYQPGPIDRSKFGNVSFNDTSIQKSRFDALPSTLCLFLSLHDVFDAPPPKLSTGAGARKGRTKLAACLGNLEHAELNFTAASFLRDSAGFHVSQAQSLQRKWNRLQVGPTFGIYLTDDFAVGASVHGIDTTYTSVWSNSSTAFDDAGHAIASNLDLAGDAYSFDIGAIVGATYHLDRFHTLGLSVTTPSLHVSGKYDASLQNQFTGAGQQALLTTGTGEFSAPPPLRIAAGLGGEYKRVKIEVDATYYFPRAEGTRASFIANQSSIQDGVAASRQTPLVIAEHADGLVNSALGFEWMANPRLSLLGGINSDFSSVPVLAQTPGVGSVALARTHRVGASLGLGSYGTEGELLVGTEVSYGWGKAYGIDNFTLPNQFGLTTLSTVRVLLVVAGSTSLTTIKRAVDTLTDIVKPSK